MLRERPIPSTIATMIWLALMLGACSGSHDEATNAGSGQASGDSVGTEASAPVGSSEPTDDGAPTGDSTPTGDSNDTSGADDDPGAQPSSPAGGLPSGEAPDDFVTAAAETSRGLFSVDMPAVDDIDVSRNSAFPITTTTMWHDGDRTFVVTVDDLTENFDTDWHSPRAQEAYAELPLLNLYFGGIIIDAELEDPGYPVTHVLPGSGEEVIGYEYDLTVAGVPGRLRSVRLDSVHYGLLAYGVNEAEWGAFVDSLVTHTPLEPSPEEVAIRADADRVIAETYGERSFIDGPFSPRELDPMTGGWGFVPGPRFGALAPGPDATLDAEWDKCRQGDGFACDELYWTSEFRSLYEAFGESCGGRSVDVWPCTDLLGGERHPDSPKTSLSRRYTNNLGGYRLDVIPGPDSPPPGEYAPSDLLWIECGLRANSQACNDLINAASDHPFGMYGAYGWTCGGRMSFSDNASCLVLLTPVDERPQAGDPAPGTIPELDPAWERCVADFTTCRGIFDARGDIADEIRTEEWEVTALPYVVFAASCGGIYDRPFDRTTCQEVAGSAMPIGDDVASLPAQPVPPGAEG